jgi:hypothetical protein
MVLRLMFLGVIRVESFLSWDAALEAAGLRE